MEFSRLFLTSKIERLGEKNLPKILVENGGIINCRMKAADFRFPAPPGSRAANLMLTSTGSVEARFQSSNQVTASEYENWLSGKVQVGGWVTVHSVPGGLLIKFSHFGDK